MCSKIIWLGDLNYRLAPGSADTRVLLERNDWQALLEKDQVIKQVHIFVSFLHGICYSYI